jgi:hypothetical protein
MSGARDSQTDEARFTPITAAGIVAIICLSGVLIGSVLQGGAAYRSPAARIASASAGSQLGTPSATAQPAALAVPIGPPLTNTASVSASGGANVTPSAPSVVGASATAPASGSSQATISTATVLPATGSGQVSQGGDSQSGSAQPPVTQVTTDASRVNTDSASATSPHSGVTNASGSAVVPNVIEPAASTTSPSASTGPTTDAATNDPQSVDSAPNPTDLSVPPGQDIQQVVGAAPGWGDFQDVWTPAMTGTGQWIIGPGGTAPPDAIPSKTIYLQPGQGAVQVNGTYVVYNGLGGVPGTLAYAP